ncbi:bifunctional phosphoribosylaminoimidazolecarboxamide formyltransferase/IMP cyclohydrolase [Candidatus Woesearchaeota archaeon]|nr:bifunctional phosphoribosylaminoimidazolecarboxamide formyltransferase/IMP cyclohydrolase [Candidatus Woesearchaeota archaeon]
MIERALISVFSKDNLGMLVEGLVKVNPRIEFVSSGGTAKAIRGMGDYNVADVSDITGFPEAFGGRVKTINPLIEGGILYDRHDPEHVATAQRLGVKPIDLVVCNLYPFDKVSADPNAKLEDIIENIDIGGPTMVISAVKNMNSVGVLVDPTDYRTAIAHLKNNGGELSQAFRETFAAKALNYLADYRARNATVLTEKLTGEKSVRPFYRNGVVLRYGENPHQAGITYKSPTDVNGIAHADVLYEGKPLSYNNWTDADAAAAIVDDLIRTGAGHAAAVVKHANPCGMATGVTPAMALAHAWAGDPVSAFGSIIALSSPADDGVLEFLKEGVYKEKQFVELVIAPGYSQRFLDWAKAEGEFAGRKPKNIRLMQYHFPGKYPSLRTDATIGRTISGGYLEQSFDGTLLPAPMAELMRPAGPEEKRGLVAGTSVDPAMEGLFTFSVLAAKHLKSNAIAIGYEYDAGKYLLIGAGMGQPNRVDSMRLAVDRALDYIHRSGMLMRQDEVLEKKTVVASDAFYPFPDGPLYALNQGFRNFIQPGGSVNDTEVIKVMDGCLARMILTDGHRHFRHQ